MEKTFYVTTPIYYVNAEPHIGHAYTTILADFLKRFYKMLGFDAYFLTGTDEHGDKIMKAAEENNSTAQEYVDRISGLFRQTWIDTGIDFDDFIRTTDDRHIKVVKEILQQVYDNGDIYFSSYGGYYCYGCERYLTDKDMIDGKCPEHNKEPEYIEENNYFFKMSKYQGWLKDYIKSNPDFIRPERYRNEVLSILENEMLEDLCISRPKTRLSWGVPLPFDDNFVTYVWFDALINYISALGYPDNEKFKKYWPESQHIIAKDIVKPHGIFWPTMLKAAGIEPYKNLNVHGYWIMDESKMSKSLGNFVRPKELISKFGNDQVRYFLLREMTFGLDAKFSEEAIVNRVNYDLANDLGNMVKRSFNMVDKYFDGKIPEFHKKNPAERSVIEDHFKNAKEEYIKHIKDFQFNLGVESLWKFIRSLNKYIDEKKPWQLHKENKNEELSSIMRNLLESIAGIAILLSPVLTETSPVILDALGCNDTINDIETLCELNFLKDNTSIKDTGILFPRLEKEGADEKPAGEKKEKGKTKKNKSDGEQVEGLVDFKEFAKIDLRVARIIEASVVEGSDKLLQLLVDSGLDKRTIIAGIAREYSPDYLIGKKILLVANLKPATIFKRESRGMLLAARSEKDGKLYLIEISESIPVGSRLS